MPRGVMRTAVTLTLLARVATSLRIEEEGGGVSYGQEGGGGVSYDPASVDLIVNIALSLFDSLQQYTSGLEAEGGGEDTVKVKFKPKLVIEQIEETEPHTDDINNSELLFLQDEPEFRDIAGDYYDDHADTSSTEDNLSHHRSDPRLTESEAGEVAVKLALGSHQGGVQGYRVDLVSGADRNNEGGDVIDDGIESEFKFLQQFPNIYSQSDSVFEVIRNRDNTLGDNNMDNLQQMNDVVTNNSSKEIEIVSERRVDNPLVASHSDQDIDNDNSTEVDDEDENAKETSKNVSTKSKKRKRKKRRKRPVDREDWTMPDSTDTADISNSSGDIEFNEIIKYNQEQLNKTKRKKKKRRKGQRKDVRKQFAPLIVSDPSPKPKKVHLSRPLMPKIQLRGRPVNLQYFLPFF